MIHTVEKLIDKITSIPSPGDIVGGITDKLHLGDIGGILHRASGGYASGLTLGGERGPELLSLPAGSRVYSNSDSRELLVAGDRAPNVVNHYFIDAVYVTGDAQAGGAAFGLGLGALIERRELTEAAAKAVFANELLTRRNQTGADGA